MKDNYVTVLEEYKLKVEDALKRKYLYDTEDKIQKFISEIDEVIQNHINDNPEEEDTLKVMKGSLNDLSDFYRWEHVLVEQQRQIDSLKARRDLGMQRIESLIKELTMRGVSINGDINGLRKEVRTIENSINHYIKKKLKSALEQISTEEAISYFDEYKETKNSLRLYKRFKNLINGISFK